MNASKTHFLLYCSFLWTNWNQITRDYKRYLLLSKTFLISHVMIYYLSLVEKIKFVILSLLRYLISLSLIHVIWYAESKREKSVNIKGILSWKEISDATSARGRAINSPRFLGWKRSMKQEKFSWMNNWVLSKDT